MSNIKEDYIGYAIAGDQEKSKFAPDMFTEDDDRGLDLVDIFEKQALSNNV